MTDATLFDARQAGRDAANACVEKAERTASFDTDGARRFILDVLSGRDHASGEELVDAAKSAGFKGHDDRCFGAVFASLVKRKQIRCVGFVTRVKGRGTAGGRLWAMERAT